MNLDELSTMRGSYATGWKTEPGVTPIGDHTLPLNRRGILYLVNLAEITHVLAGQFTRSFQELARYPNMGFPESGPAFDVVDRPVVTGAGHS